MPAEQEPHIVINGVVLNTAQAMSVRNAIFSHRQCLAENGLGDDDMGKRISAAYQARLSEVERILLSHLHL